MGWSDDEDEEFNLNALDATVAAATARRDRPRDDDGSKRGSTTASRFIDDEAEADEEVADDTSLAEEEAEAEVQAEVEADSDDDKKSGVSAEEKEETSKKAPNALLYMVNQLATEVGKETGMQFSKQMLSLVREVVHDHVRAIGADVEQFAKHAKRTMVNIEDVMLGVRNNPSLKAALEEFQQAQHIGVGKKRPKKRTKQSDDEEEDGGRDEAVASSAKRSGKRASAGTKRSKRAAK